MNSSNVSSIKPTTVQLFSNIEILQGTRGIYYNFAGNCYDIHFPLEYALNAELYCNGLCETCLSVGFMHGVFVGFCASCIDNKYGYSKGNGMLPGCIERTELDDSEIDFTNSVWNTYLYEVDPFDIGGLVMCEAPEIAKQMEIQVSHEYVRQELLIHENKSTQSKDPDPDHNTVQDPNANAVQEQSIFKVEQMELVCNRLKHTAMFCGNN